LGWPGTNGSWLPRNRPFTKNRGFSRFFRDGNRKVANFPHQPTRE
jgi:hypothetical protein